MFQNMKPLEKLSKRKKNRNWMKQFHERQDGAVVWELGLPVVDPD